MNNFPDNDDPYKDLVDEDLLQEVYRKYGKKQNPGDPPLESLAPSKRLVPHSPLTPAEVNAVCWAECRFFKLKLAPPDDPIYQTGWTISFVPHPRRHIPPQTSDSSSSDEQDAKDGVALKNRDEGGGL